MDNTNRSEKKLLIVHNIHSFFYPFPLIILILPGMSLFYLVQKYHYLGLEEEF